MDLSDHVSVATFGLAASFDRRASFGHAVGQYARFGPGGVGSSAFAAKAPTGSA
jgi:hypothetical protein